MEMVILVVIFFIVLVVILLSKNKNERYSLIEGYRDPIYLNRAKYAYEYYPRANGSIYGFPYSYGGSWNILSGFPFYDKAY